MVGVRGLGRVGVAAAIVAELVALAVRVAGGGQPDRTGGPGNHGDFSKRIVSFDRRARRGRLKFRMPRR
jgi:hypothetical protein